MIAVAIRESSPADLFSRARAPQNRTNIVTGPSKHIVSRIRIAGSLVACPAVPVSEAERDAREQPASKSPGEAISLGLLCDLFSMQCLV